MLATKIPERKFDFSLDYEVINDLGAALYARARIELPVTSPARRDYLMKAIAAYRRTLAIDSEDVAAHCGLAQAYSDPAWGDQAADEPPADSRRRRRARPSRSTPTRCVKLAASIADPKVAAAERRSRALRLARDIARFMDGPGRATSRGSSRCTTSSRSSARPGTPRPTRTLGPPWPTP